jgi:hypothetical protein
MEKETSHVNMQSTSRRRRAPLTMASAILVSLAASSPAIASQREGMLFTGAGYGPTRDYAIQAAIWDAETSASAYQFYTCELVGEPRIFPGPNPEWSRNFSAEADVFCTP